VDFMSDANRALSEVPHDELLRELRRRSEAEGAPDAALARLSRLEALVERLCASTAEMLSVGRTARSRDTSRSDAELYASIESIPITVGAAARGDVPTDAGLGRSASSTGYAYPPLALLDSADSHSHAHAVEVARMRGLQLARVLREHRMHGRITSIVCGVSVTTYHFEPALRTQLKKFEGISSQLAQALAVRSVRLASAVASGASIAIEVPNEPRTSVPLKQLMSSGGAEGMALPMFMGEQSSGDPLVLDLATLPHLLVTGVPGSGKSVCLNSIIMSLLCTKRADELRLLMVDRCKVELGPYAGIPHLMCPVANTMSRAAAILEWIDATLDERYELLMQAGVRDISAFNALAADERSTRLKLSTAAATVRATGKLPYLVFVIDELADLMMVHSEVEQSIVRIAQKGRSVGIHMILATQRPQPPIVTKLIRLNIQSRVVLKAASVAESRIVLDQKGAELLLGQGDMLVRTPEHADASRCQGALVVEREVHEVVNFLKSAVTSDCEIQFSALPASVSGAEDAGNSDSLPPHEQDPLFDKAVEILIEGGRGSVSLLQRRLAIGYGRASRLVDLMGQAGLLGEHKGSQAREVIVTMEEWQRMKALRDQQGREGTG
jgi:S-DNA-T family DNA segregation ATPase FtsK/SpoIIIE